MSAVELSWRLVLGGSVVLEERIWVLCGAWFSLLYDMQRWLSVLLTGSKKKNKDIRNPLHILNILPKCLLLIDLINT